MIAITGANGLLGSFIVRRLIDAGQSFVAIKRANSDVSLLADVQDRITWRDADVLDRVSLDEALQDVDTVIHAAAIVSFNPRDKKRVYEVNVTGTRNVVDACLVHNIKQLIHISSVAAIGRPKGITDLDESQKWEADAFHSVYAQSKYYAELEVMRGHVEGLNAVMVNPSIILGPGDWDKSSAQLFKYVWSEKPFYAEGQLNYVDVRDVAAIVYALLGSAHSGERFIVNAGTMSYQELFYSIAEKLGKKPPTIKLNKKLLKILAWVSTVFSLIIGTTPLITRETARNAGNFFFYNNKKVTNKLNFSFQTIDQTLNWCCDYYLKQVNGKN